MQNASSWNQRFESMILAGAGPGREGAGLGVLALRLLAGFSRAWLSPGCFLAACRLLPSCFLAASWLLPGCFLAASWLLSGCFQAVYPRRSRLKGLICRSDCP